MDESYLRGSATITDEQFVEAIADLRRPMRYAHEGDGWDYYSLNINELAEFFDIHRNRIRSKLRRTMKRGLTDGCTCGCRGDIRLLRAGEDLLTKVLVTKYYGFNQFFGVDDGIR